jgi:hypothetical protein
MQNFLVQKSSSDEHIDFENEISEFIRDHLIDSYTLIEKDQSSAKLRIITLEKKYIVVSCQVGQGITVINSILGLK